MPRKPPDASLDKLAALVAAGASVRAAAKSLGVPERTARRYTAEETFKQSVISFRRQIMSRTIGKLTVLSAKAAATLGKLLDDGDPEIRLKAARAVLGDMLAVQAQNDIGERLEALEVRAAPAANRYGRGSY